MSSAADSDPSVNRLRMLPLWIFTAVLLLLLILLVAVGRSSNSTESPVTSTSTSTTATFALATSTTAPDSLPINLAALRIEDPVSRPGYERDLFPTWLDLDGNGCNAREDVLTAESMTPVTKTGRCKIVSGSWLSIYDGATFTDPLKLDIDHMVPLAEAWRSGAYAWTADRRAAYANDSSDGPELIAVSASSNRQKSDSPPDRWRPTDHGSWCAYASSWIQVKVQWDLTATRIERDALGQMLETCPS